MVVAVLVLLLCGSVPAVFQKASVMIPLISSATPTIATEYSMDGVLNPETHQPTQPSTVQSWPQAHVPGPRSTGIFLHVFLYWCIHGDTYVNRYRGDPTDVFLQVC